MSLSNTTVGTTYSCNGVTTTFAIPFAYQATTEIKVYLILISTGVETLQTLTTHYTYTPNDIAPTSIVMVSAPASTYRLRVERATTRTQDTDYINNSSFLAEDHEEALDHIVQQVQELGLRSDNALRVSRIDYGVDPVFPLLVAESLLRVNDDGDGFDLGPTLTDFNADVQAASDDADAAAASAAAASASASSASTSASSATASASAASSSAAAALASEVAAAASAASVLTGIPVVSGSFASPNLITAVGGITFPGGTARHTTMFIAGNGGAVIITANPQISAATSEGQELELIQCHATNFVTIADGTGTHQNGDHIMEQYNSIRYKWMNSLWVEMSRRAI